MISKALLSIIIIIFPCLTLTISAQESDANQNNSAFGNGGYAFGLKGGSTIATQTWNGFQLNALFSYHTDLFVEVLGPWKDKNGSGKFQRSSFTAQLGYHLKGSTFRNVFVYAPNGQYVKVPSNDFHNLSLTLLGKGAFKTNEISNAYYAFGLRLDYTVSFQLLQQSTFGVNRFNYGVWLGGGYEWQIKNGPWALFIEANISPDLSRQVFIPAGLPSQYRDANGNNLPTTEQKVVNLVFELSAGIKLYK
jgi:hypothetical protein